MNRKTTNAIALAVVRILSVTTIILLVAIIGYIAFRGIWKQTRVIRDVVPLSQEEKGFVISAPASNQLSDLSWFTLRNIAQGKIYSLRNLSGVDSPVTLYITDDVLPAFLSHMDLSKDKVVYQNRIPDHVERGGIVISSKKGKNLKKIPLYDEVLAVNPTVAALYGNNRIAMVEPIQWVHLQEGSVRSWKELGGPDMPVRNVSTLDEVESTEGSYLVVDAAQWQDAKDAGHAITSLQVVGIESGVNLTWDYMTEKTVESGKYGGIGTIIVNTFFMVMLTILFSLPIGVAAALWLCEYAKEGKMKSMIQSGIDILSALPSIIFGLFGLLVFVQLFHWGFSLISGTLTVSLMVLPTIIRTSQEAIASVDRSLSEASLALGATKIETILRVVLPSSKRGIITGMILAIGRAIGETAALIYTIGSGTDIAHSLTSSSRVLAMHIFLTITEGQSTDKAFASALVLIVLVLVINTVANRLIHTRRR
ncbi:MAG: phosphate ABC transporter permease PstA [Sphaerochaeta sp.]|jgi:phosphate transport system permease protein|nr:phosphate ABC transporter permease PstA [Sphaerochaeta sp.]MCH3919793.1 phosphate ABC transporter permease PstA [Sphaerochaeta sp.]MCI2045699.1 phosphate ABC transporter permease PstA [Sphaerochaeta sp.]MCI2076445.1 phosphate ABC transporter permease PstA [Sphaerochaeta sp.]MCI2096643.1 phosphate ABC transporter permease PstA [Sphaerochaeta sp.]